MKEEKYNQQYCKKHNQEYAGYLIECPICVGERMKSIPARETYKPKKFKRRRKNHDGNK